MNLPILDISYKWNRTICDFCVWLLSFSIMFSRFLQIAACISISFLLISKDYAIVFIYHSCFSTFGLFPLLATVNSMLLWMCMDRYFFWVRVFSSLGYNYFGVELLGHILCLTYWGTAKLFSTAAETFYIPTSSNFSSSSPTLAIFQSYSHPQSVKWYLIMVLTCTSLMINDIEHLFMCLLVVLNIFFGRNPSHLLIFQLGCLSFCCSVVFPLLSKDIVTGYRNLGWSSFLSVLGKFCVTSSGLHGFWWEICHSSSPSRKMSFFIAFKIFSLILAFSSLTIMCQINDMNLFRFILFEVCLAPWMHRFYPSAIFREFQPLFLSVLFTVLFFFFFLLLEIWWHNRPIAIIPNPYWGSQSLLLYSPQDSAFFFSFYFSVV